MTRLPPQCLPIPAPSPVVVVMLVVVRVILPRGRALAYADLDVDDRGRVRGRVRVRVRDVWVGFLLHARAPPLLAHTHARTAHNIRAHAHAHAHAPSCWQEHITLRWKDRPEGGVGLWCPICTREME